VVETARDGQQRYVALRAQRFGRRGTAVRLLADDCPPHLFVQLWRTRHPSWPTASSLPRAVPASAWNSVAERFFVTSKTRPWPIRRAAQQAIFSWINVPGDRHRCHPTPAYQVLAIFGEVLLVQHSVA